MSVNKVFRYCAFVYGSTNFKKLMYVHRFSIHFLKPPLLSFSQNSDTSKLHGQSNTEKPIFTQRVFFPDLPSTHTGDLSQL